MWSATRGTTRFYDAIVENSEPRAKGRCLCGAVAYEVHGPMRDISICHCIECRRWSGHLGAFSATKAEDIVVDGDALRWAESPESDRYFRRGFCGLCGSSLLLQSSDSEYVSVAVGTLDRPTGLRIAGHWYSHQAGDWDEVPDDGLPRDDELARSERRWT
jgi:hypothetical protein